MAVRKKGGVVYSARFRDHAIDACANLIGAFTARTPIGEDHPSGVSLTDLARREPLVLAVVPFHEVGLDLGPLGETSELTRLPRSTEGARQNQVEGDHRQ
jgi:hypothetical protein